MTNGLTQVRLLHCGIFFLQINHCVSQPVLLRLIRSGWEVLFCSSREAQREFSPGLILWNWWSDYYHSPHTKDWQALSESDQVQHLPIRDGGNISNNWHFYVTLSRREREGGREVSAVDQTILCLPRTPECEDLIWRDNNCFDVARSGGGGGLDHSHLTTAGLERDRQSSNRRHLI